MFAASEDNVQDAYASTTRGQTPFLPLRDHFVTWDHPLSAVVQMFIDRNAHRLLPHPFKFKVVQRVIPGDPDAPQNPRLGVVELDLAEYTDSVPAMPNEPSKGTVTRHYLLRDSMRHAPPLHPRRAPSLRVAAARPPLPHSEILAGVAAATLLSTRVEVYRTRPHALDLYARAPMDDDHVLLIPADGPGDARTSATHASSAPSRASCTTPCRRCPPRPRSWHQAAVEIRTRGAHRRSRVRRASSRLTRRRR
ncbi:hypothetical protein K438DRAFT_1839496 [Mycena galopus ATCC 62051]|nr:hypothetical protein K438DRAFT_1839496 [Mycena galopus ATCC 62051]